MEQIDLENVVNAIMALKNDDAGIKSILIDDDFLDFCPEFGEFFDNYGVMLLSQKDKLNMDF